MLSTVPSHLTAYIMADSGYDVWLGNARGNAYSRNHTTLNPDGKDGKFWDFRCVCVCVCVTRVATFLLPLLLIHQPLWGVWKFSLTDVSYIIHRNNLCYSSLQCFLCSWDEMGQYDVPAMIDYMLNKTSHTKLYYIGHSMGKVCVCVCVCVF